LQHEGLRQSETDHNIKKGPNDGKNIVGRGNGGTNALIPGTRDFFHGGYCGHKHDE